MKRWIEIWIAGRKIVAALPEWENESALERLAVLWKASGFCVCRETAASARKPERSWSSGPSYRDVIRSQIRRGTIRIPLPSGMRPTVNNQLAIAGLRVTGRTA